ncbi:MAG: hypothetical protein Unbinned706contig1000_66 [Prokaryotic dsDNA virus sp.]|nr:MAG: hypothetical protein Unbinned706contig1000_66 [Prokaryotic dsDNA virus sp.]|tara:strand:+ start:5797 stop:6012 length:216 start_codon:yes stop_codon:yes gene_type:complete
MNEQAKEPTVSNPVEAVVSGADETPRKIENTVFDLMFHGCQQINVPQAMELLGKIRQGKIRGIKMQDGYLD